MEQTICIFGDSITWGAWDTEKGGWVNRLKNYFENNNIDVAVYNCGISGDNTNGLLKRFKNEALARKADIVLFAIGINDSQYINDHEVVISIEDFQNNLLELINQAKEISQKVIFIGLTKVDESKTMPVSWNVNKYYDLENIKLYNTKIKEICDNNNLLFIDMFELLENTDSEDGLHPTPQGHEKMFLKIKEILLSEKIV
ncbi:hypothetical protein C4566_02315 [Candidatus Parcubacteria bacterium]|nr:MAG: hypothetical protein C4566_02315 [Candidatus Parcubacteria bacterium]